MRKALAAPAIAIAAMAFPLLTMSAAQAADSTSYQADLGSLNESGVTGTAMITLDGDQATVQIDASGLLDGAPHAQHIHIGAQGVCPTAADDANGDGIVSTPEAQDKYGMIGASLTVSGDTSPDSALAVDRFPSSGTESYSRTFTASSDVVQSLQGGTGVVVVHGIDPNGSGSYDGDAKSELDPSLPLEATAPAACGALAVAQMGSVPQGSADTGGGATAGVEDQLALGLGGLAAAGAAAAGVVAFRRRQTEQA